MHRLAASDAGDARHGDVRMSDPLDFAEILAAAERDAGIARVQAAVAETGAADCADCGDAIPDLRRAAVPFAVRCAGCQGLFERGRRDAG